MNFLSALKKLFKAKNLSKELVSPSDIASIPTRDVFKNNPTFINQIDTYKQEYLTKLSSDNFNLDENELLTQIKMLVDLTLNGLLKTDMITDNPNVLKRIKFLITSKKLLMYLERIKQLENDITAKIIALQEIYVEKPFLARKKKYNIKSLLETLANSYLIIQNEIVALALEIKNYFINGTLNYQVNADNIDSENKIVYDQRQLLLKFQETIFGTVKHPIREDKTKIIEDLADAQKLLEIYVYEHQNERDILLQKLNDIYQQYTKLDLNDLTNSYNKELLKQITNLETKFRVFYEYGSNLITEMDLKELYNLKFAIETMAPIGFIEPIITDDFELEYYKKIIYHQIELIITGKNPNFQEIFAPNTEKAIEVFKNILKHGKSTLDIPTILNSKYLLNFLLSLNSKEDLIAFLKNFKVKKDDCPYFNFANKIFKWEDEIPLETVYRFMLALNIGDDALLYELLKDSIYPNDKLYYLPEGIKVFQYYTTIFKTIPAKPSPVELIIIKMRELAKDKIVILPNSLKEFRYNIIFEPISIKKFIFKEGLEVLPWEIYNMEIISRSENKITYRDTRTNHIITSDLNCKKIILNSETYELAGLLTFIPEKNLHIDEYTLYKKGANALEDAKNAIEARRKQKNADLSCTYVDVATKYGDFCLYLENNYMDAYPPFSLTLYQGKYQDIINSADTTQMPIWTKYGVFKISYEESYHRTHLEFNPNSSIFYSPLKRDVWLYDKDTHQENPIYCTEGNGRWGIILHDGKLKLSEIKKNLPPGFKSYQLPELVDLPSFSKAYFGNNFNDCIAILKRAFGGYDYNIFINQIKKYSPTQRAMYNIDDEYYAQCLRILDIPYCKIGFIQDDFPKIIDAVKRLNIRDDLKTFIIASLENYQNIYFEESYFKIATDNNSEFMLVNLQNYLKDGYLSMCDILENCNIQEYVEKLLELISKTYNISIEDLLPNRAQESKYTRKLEKN